MRDYFLKLFAHEHWANAKLFAALSALPSVPPRTLELCPHIMSAHQFWDKRFAGEDVNSGTFEWFPKLTLSECQALNEVYAQKWARFFTELPLPIDAQTLSYAAQDGPVTVRVIDIFTQLHGHSTHHRAQISTDLRIAGIEPLITDYYLFCRETA